MNPHPIARYTRSLVLGACVFAGASLSAQTVNVLSAAYLRSGNPDANFGPTTDGRLLVGFHHNSALLNQRALLEFDLSAFSSVSVDSVTLTMTTHDTSIHAGDDDLAGGFPYELELLALDETFDPDTVTWNSLSTPGGDVGATVLSTTLGSSAAADTPEALGVDVTFGSTSAFTSEVQAAIDGDGILGILVYIPSVEAVGVAGSGLTGMYRFLNTPTLNLSVTAVPEPSALVLLLGVTSLGLFLRRRRR